MPSWKKVIISGSDAALNSLTVTNGITGSLFGTASFSTSASYAASTSQAVTASYINPLTQNVQLTGSLFVTSSTATLGQFAGNQNGFVEFSVRNNSTGVSASGDIAVYANDGTALNNYIDMGINNSGLSNAYFYGGTDFGDAHDAYVYNVGGNLRIGNATLAANSPSQSLFLFSNPSATPNIWVTGSQVAIGKSTGSINGAFDINGNTTITGSLKVTNSNASMASLMGFTTTATAGGTTTLTNTSSYYQLFTGVLTQTVRLPVTSTLQTGWTFHICNNSTNPLSLVSSGGNSILTVIAGTTVMVTCIGTTLTTAADWEAGYTDFSTATGTGGGVVLATGPTFDSPQATGPLSFTGTSFSFAQFHTAATTGNTTIGGSAQTGNLTLGLSTGSQTTNIQAGAAASASIKTLNIGTGGLTGSITNINIGSTNSGRVNISGSCLITGLLRITGSLTTTGDIITQGNIIAQQYIVSSSVSYFTESFSSGSTKFGDSSDDTHQFTGSVLITGSLNVIGNQTSSGSLTLFGPNNNTPNIKTQNSSLILEGNAGGFSLFGTQFRLTANPYAWTDSVTSSYFQVKTTGSFGSNNYVTFQGGTWADDAPFDRLQFSSYYTSFNNGAYGITPVPTASVEIVNSNSGTIPLLQLKTLVGQTSNYLNITSGSTTTAGNVFNSSMFESTLKL